MKAVSHTCHALHSLTSSPALEAAWLWRWHGDQALFQAPVMSLSLAVLRQLVEVHHADMNAVPAAGAADDFRGRALLHFACKADRRDLVGYLASAPGIDVNQTFGLEKTTPLHAACNCGSVQAASQLLALPQIQVNAVTSDGASSLYLACTEQKVEIVEELLRHPDIDVNLAFMQAYPRWLLQLSRVTPQSWPCSSSAQRSTSMRLVYWASEACMLRSEIGTWRLCGSY